MQTLEPNTSIAVLRPLGNIPYLEVLAAVLDTVPTAASPTLTEKTIDTKDVAPLLTNASAAPAFGKKATGDLLPVRYSPSASRVVPGNVFPVGGYDEDIPFRKRGTPSDAPDIITRETSNSTWVKVNYDLPESSLITAIQADDGNVRLRYTNIQDKIDIVDITLRANGRHLWTYTAPNGSVISVNRSTTLTELCMAIWNYVFLAENLSAIASRSRGNNEIAGPLIRPLFNPIIPRDPGLIIDPSTGKPLPKSSPLWNFPCTQPLDPLPPLPFDPELDYGKDLCIPHDLKCSVGTDYKNDVTFWFPFCGSIVVNVESCCLDHDISLWCATGPSKILPINTKVNGCIQDKILEAIRNRAHGILCNLFAYSYEAVSYLVTSFTIIGGLELVVEFMRADYLGYGGIHNDSCLCGGKLPTRVCNDDPSLSCCDICGAYGKQESCYMCHWACYPNPFGGSTNNLVFVTSNDEWRQTNLRGLPCCPGTEQSCQQTPPVCL